MKLLAFFLLFPLALLAADPGKSAKVSAGATNVLARLAPLCDLTLMREAGSISYNLRTLVLAPNGTVSQVFAGNLWTAAQLAEALVKAAATPKAKKALP